MLHPPLRTQDTPNVPIRSSVATPSLTPRHAEVLRRSAIDLAVAAEAGCVSVTPDDPRLEAFADYQRADGILFPVHPPDGSNGRYQLRRDRDRVTTDPKTGKQRSAKYEQPTGQAHRLDIHPRSRIHLRDVTIPLYVTEGIKKAWALTSLGRAAIALGGVWCCLLYTSPSPRDS